MNHPEYSPGDLVKITGCNKTTIYHNSSKHLLFPNELCIFIDERVPRHVDSRFIRLLTSHGVALVYGAHTCLA